MELSKLSRTQIDIVRDALLARRDEIDGAIAALTPPAKRGRPPKANTAGSSKNDPLAAARNAIAKSTDVPTRLTPKGRKAIAAAQKKRWAEKREVAAAAGATASGGGDAE